MMDRRLSDKEIAERKSKINKCKTHINQLIELIGEKDFISFCTDEGYVVDLNVVDNALYICVTGENKTEVDYDVNPIPYFKDI